MTASEDSLWYDLLVSLLEPDAIDLGRLSAGAVAFLELNLIFGLVVGEGEVGGAVEVLATVECEAAEDLRVHLFELLIELVHEGLYGRKVYFSMRVNLEESEADVLGVAFSSFPTAAYDKGGMGNSQ